MDAAICDGENNNDAMLANQTKVHMQNCWFKNYGITHVGSDRSCLYNPSMDIVLANQNWFIQHDSVIKSYDMSPNL